MKKNMSQKVARTSLPACKKELLFGAASPAGGVGLVTTCSSSSAQSAETRPLCRACALNIRLLTSSALMCSTSNTHLAIHVLSCYFSPHQNVIFRQMMALGPGEQSSAHPAVPKKAGGESRLVADFSAQPVGWAELTPITLHNLLER